MLSEETIVLEFGLPLRLAVSQTEPMDGSEVEVPGEARLVVFVTAEIGDDRVLQRIVSFDSLAVALANDKPPA